MSEASTRESTTTPWGALSDAVCSCCGPSCLPSRFAHDLRDHRPPYVAQRLIRAWPALLIIIVKPFRVGRSR